MGNTLSYKLSSSFVDTHLLVNQHRGKMARHSNSMSMRCVHVTFVEKSLDEKTILNITLCDIQTMHCFSVMHVMSFLQEMIVQVHNQVGGVSKEKLRANMALLKNVV